LRRAIRRTSMAEEIPRDARRSSANNLAKGESVRRADKLIIPAVQNRERNVRGRLVAIPRAQGDYASGIEDRYSVSSDDLRRMETI